MLSMITAIGLLGYAVCLIQYLRSKKIKNDSDFSLSLLPEFPDSCKLYYEHKLGRMCKRCAASNVVSELTIRRRYMLFKDSGGILKVKNLTHVYHCVTCGYKGLYLEKNDKEIK